MTEEVGAVSDGYTPSNYSGGNLSPRSRNMPAVEQNKRYAGGRNRERTQETTIQHAKNLANHLSSRGITAEHLETMHPNVAQHHAMSAGVAAPDDQVWALAHKILRVSQQAEQPY